MILEIDLADKSRVVLLKNNYFFRFFHCFIRIFSYTIILFCILHLFLQYISVEFLIDKVREFFNIGIFAYLMLVFVVTIFFVKQYGKVYIQIDLNGNIVVCKEIARKDRVYVYDRALVKKFFFGLWSSFNMKYGQWNRTIAFVSPIFHEDSFFQFQRIMKIHYPQRTQKIKEKTKRDLFVLKILYSFYSCFLIVIALILYSLIASNAIM